MTNQVETNALDSPGRRASRRPGAVLIVLAFALPVFLIMAAFAVNVAYMELTRTELRSATDFAARAGSRTLSITGSQSSALAAAQDAAARNVVAGQPLVVDPLDVEFGVATRLAAGGYAYTPGGANPNAVSVLGARTGVGAEVGLLFGDVFSTTQFEPTMQALAAQIDRDIAIVLDRSGSMASKKEDGGSTGWEDGEAAPGNSRWVKAVEAVTDFLNALGTTPMDENVALVTFSGTATIDENLSADYSSIVPTLNNYTQAYIEGQTNIADGIEFGRQALVESGLNRPWAGQTIVVITDGVHNAGATTPSQAAATAAAEGIIIHTITFGADANQTDMIDVAAIGHGQHWHAPQKGELVQAFNDIADNSSTLLIQ